MEQGHCILPQKLQLTVITLKRKTIFILDWNGSQLVGAGVANNPACSAPGLPLYQLRIPTALMLHGVLPAQQPPAIPNHWTIDLFAVQRNILRFFNSSK